MDCQAKGHMNCNMDPAPLMISVHGAEPISFSQPDDSNCSAELVEDTPPCDMEIEQSEPFPVHTHEHEKGALHPTPLVAPNVEQQVRNVHCTYVSNLTLSLSC